MERTIRVPMNAEITEFTQVHLCQSIRGPLTKWTPRDWKKATKWMTKNDGSTFTPYELKQEFLNLLAAGNEVIPIGECDNFDPKKGCLGHRKH